MRPPRHPSAPDGEQEFLQADSRGRWRQSSSARRRLWRLALGLVGVAVLAVVLWHHRPAPQFASLASSPDPGLHGTVAITRGDCAYLLTASGSSQRTQSCWPNHWPQSNVNWSSDGMEVVVYNNRGSPAPGVGPAVLEHEYRMIDVVTGETEVWAVPSGTFEMRSPSTRSAGDYDHSGTLSPSTWVASGVDGSVAWVDPETATIKFSRPGSTASALSVDGGSGYHVERLEWSSDLRWFLVQDSEHRLLVVPVDGSEIRLLATDVTDAAYLGAELPPSVGTPVGSSPSAS